MTEQDPRSSTDSRGSIDISRRHVVAGLGGLAVGGVAGGAYFLTTGGPETIEPQKPNDDGEASLGEFYWLLENHGPKVGHLDVKKMQYFPGSDRIELTYRSDAKAREQGKRTSHHVNEVGQVIAKFAIYVKNDTTGKGKVVDVTITNTFPAQSTSYQVKRSWVEKLNKGIWSNMRIINEVLRTASGGQGTVPVGNASDTTTTGGNTTEGTTTTSGGPTTS